MKKVVMIHTSPVSLNDLKELVKDKLPEVELVNIIDDSLLEEVKQNGGLTPHIISRMATYVQVADGMHPDLIFNQCSSVGEAFDIAKQMTTIPTLKIDEAMAEKAVSLGNKIAVIATVASTMKPSCNLVYTKAKAAGKEVEVIEYLVNGALDILMKEKNVEKHNALVLEQIKRAEQECDVIVLAQGSMTAILPHIKECAKPVLTSPVLAIERMKEMLYE